MKSYQLPLQSALTFTTIKEKNVLISRTQRVASGDTKIVAKSPHNEINKCLFSCKSFKPSCNVYKTIAT
jgi:hypothetical protein